MLMLATLVVRAAYASDLLEEATTTTSTTEYAEEKKVFTFELFDAAKAKNKEYEVELLRMEKVKNTSTTSTTSTTQPAAALKSQQLLASLDVEILEPEVLRDLLAHVGFEGESLRMAWAIVMRESRGKPMAHNGNSNTGDNSYGLFQINMIGYLGRDRMERYNLSSYEDLFDPLVNAGVAYKMSGKGSDFGAWGVGPNAYNGGKVGDIPYWLTQYPEK